MRVQQAMSTRGPREVRPAPLRDGHGRAIDYLRISVTERCNYRCVYCMPLEEPGRERDEHILSAREIETICRAAVDLGFRKFRLTGGEPTIRSDLLEIVQRVARIPGVDDLAMTTNGSRLPQLATSLAEAGLMRVNVHLDARASAVMARLMRWSRPERTWEGILAAEKAGLRPVKLNAVVARGFNDEAAIDLARLTIEHPWQVRFIELMPMGVGAEADFAAAHFVPNEETARRIEDALGPLEAVGRHDRADECRVHRLRDAAGSIGFISPVSQPYCGHCNRLRLTADGMLHLCLLRDGEVDLRTALRRGGESAVRDRLRQAVAAKPIGHELAEGRYTQGRRMHAIGG